jgi:hypothetical protein
MLALAAKRNALFMGFSALVLSACSDVTGPESSAIVPLRSESVWIPGSGREPFKVYTQNAYLGGDTGPIFSIDFGNVPALAAATNVFWAQVQASHIPDRAAAIVEQIDRARPHLVALQEVFRFRLIDFSSGSAMITPAGDLLASIEDAIAARGLPYTVVRVQANTALGYPPSMALPGLPLSQTTFLGFEDRIAVLRRNDVALSSVASGNFTQGYPLGPLSLRRGWIRVTTDVDGTPHHLIATHLEGQALAPIQALQASELVSSVAGGLGGVTILAGDFNSDAANPGAPSWTPTYDALVASGFTDAWLASGQAAGDPGYTCCQNPDLTNGSSVLDERIDFVLVRDGRSRGMRSGSIQVEIVGEEQADRVPGTGLWPADHAGLVAGLRLAPGLSVTGG